MNYYSKIIQENEGDPRTLFSTFDTLLHRKAEKKLPHTNDNESLANAFVDFFTTKISLICDELQVKRNSVENISELGNNYCGTKLTEFEPVYCDDLSKLIGTSTLKSCALDPLPASVLKECLHQLLPFLTKLVNVSLQHGVVSTEMKQAIITPVLKKPSLDQEEYSNYRPISNLLFLSKTCEKVVAAQLTRHLQNNYIQEIYQSAYKTGHSTETALLRVQNDVLRAIDSGRCVILLLLDQSAAFDTVNHLALLERLTTQAGVDETAHKWFASYLSDRQQSVCIEKSRSSSRPLSCGIPQGSVLGPLLYLIYTLPLGAILRRHDVSYHMYADDTQVYLSFKSSVLADIEGSRAKVEDCLSDVNKWMLHNNLKLNNDKTEVLILHSKHRPMPPLQSVKVGDVLVKSTDDARNIGVIFDTTMNLEKHINDICRISFYHIRNISRIRRYLSFESAKTLVHAFVISRIDNNNALLYGLPDYLIKRLQHVLNTAARLVSLTRRIESITPILYELHWLPVQYRIIFKILLFSYKITTGVAPGYLNVLLNRYDPKRSLRSEHKLFLEQPVYKLKSYGLRSFCVCAPMLWNKLPTYIKESSTLAIFKKNLKTHLFKEAFNL